MSESPSASAPSATHVELFATPGFMSWLAEQRVSLAFTTYQKGELFFVGLKASGEPAILKRYFRRCMGLWGDEQTIWMSAQFQLWRFDNVLLPGKLYQDHDRLYIPRVGYTTGDLSIHDIVVEPSGRVVFVNTRFSCLATLSERCHFRPLWRPPFVSTLVPEDRCHLNGLAVDNGRCRYVTAAGVSDVRDGWREQRRHGGCVLEVPSGRVVLGGLSMPHSPRIYRERLWVLHSGTGQFGWVDREQGTFEPVAFCPGYARGLAFTGDYAVVGLSRPRYEDRFSDLLLDDELARRNTRAICGLCVIDLRSGAVAHQLLLEGAVRELYDVIVLPGVVRPMAFGFQSDEIQNMIAVDREGTL
jgi:uncharacterized protein (TIGR03032 family)